MSPEVVQGRYSELCDVWSIGVTFYQMVTGQRLWRHADTKENHFSELLEPLSKLGNILYFYGYLNPIRNKDVNLYVPKLNPKP